MGNLKRSLKKISKVITPKDIVGNPEDDDIRSVSCGMHLEYLNWDDEYKKDIKSGLGFDIDDTNAINKNNVRSERGIYSPLYGMDLSDDSSYIDQWSCKCKDRNKRLRGKFYDDGTTRCPNCGSLITYNNTDMKKTGWITLRSDIHLINPLYYYMLEKVISKKHLNNIIYYNKERDKDGNVIVNMDYYDKDNPFYAIGMTEFYNRYEEILNYYKDNIKGSPHLRQEKLELYELLINNKDRVFCNHFPVYTLLIRPILMIKNNMVYANINRKFQSLLTNVVDLNKTDTTMDLKDLKVLPLLYQSQKILNQIHRITIDEQISKKEGHIRNAMLGVINFLIRSTKNILIAG